MNTIDEILEKCRGDELPPCQATCPLHVDARGYINLIKQGNLEGALKLVYEKLPFPGTMGRICTHPCEVKCRRTEIDSAIAIASLKRFIADKATVSKNWFPPLPENRKERIAIIGAGPTGLMAAHDLRRWGYQVTVFEASPFAGGAMRQAIPAFRLPRAVLDREIEWIQDLGVDIKTNTKIEHLGELLDQGFDAIFVVTGAPLSKKLDVPGKDLEGVLQGLDLLKEVNLGYEVTVKGKVLVIGGGNVAIDSGRTAIRLNCDTVVILYRRSREEMPANPEEVAEAQKEGVEIEYLSAPLRIIGEGGKVVGVECIRMGLGEKDSSGRRRPIPIEGSEFYFAADTVIVAVGQVPDLSYLKGEGLQIVRGLVSVNSATLQTSLPQVFAGGDVVTGPGVVIDALAAGRRAAMAIDRYLRGEAQSVAGETLGSRESMLKVDIEGIASKERTAMPLRPLEQRQSFDEIELGFSEEQAAQEAERCIQCECNLCVKSCEFLKSACDTPTELAKKLKNGHFREMPKIPYSCNLCGLCRRLCPEELDMGRVCLDLRRQLVAEGLGPLPGHKAVISEQEWVASDAFFTVLNGTDSGTSQRLFFPGCSLSAYSPDLVARTYEYLQRKLPGTGIILGCCGAPSYMIGDQTCFQDMMGRITTQMEKSGTSELILACPDCYHTFRENAPNIQVRLVYELMIEQGLPEAARAQSGKSFSIHDSCKTRYESGIQDSVRAIAEKLGYSIKEPEFSRDKTRCCGMGGMASYVDVKLVNKVTMMRAKEMSQDVLTYCASCRNSFALVGKPSVHILDVIFGSELEKTKRRSPVIGKASRKNQSELKARLSEIAGTAAR